jgi:outer membrane receptor protein involved in Fe transport
VLRKSLLVQASAAALLCAGLPAVARAEGARAEGTRAEGAAAAPVAPEIVVTARRLDAAREQIEPALGASSYTVPQALIANLPGGANARLSQVVLQTPGVAQDSFGQLHIRGDHGNIQYRLNNVILPEGLAVFGQTLSPRLASSLELITGALPAQYGLRTAGVIDITTKTGLHPGGDVGVYGGGSGLVTPSVEYGGTWGASSAYGTLSYTGTNVGVESPDGRARPIHDHSDQVQAFGYFDHILDDTSRISAVLGTSQQRFEIPNIAGLQPDLGLNVDGRTDFASADLDSHQREATSYAIGSYLKSAGKLTLQASLQARYSTLTYTPDEVGELLFNGIAQAARKTDLSVGTQIEGAYQLNDAHTLRGGVVISTDRTTSRTNSQVLPTDAAGTQTSDQPLTILQSSNDTAWTYSAFLQDEWKLNQALTLNYGLRFDAVNAARSERQVSPRVNLVWTPLDATTVHFGYARYFTPAPFELVANESVAAFANTTAQPPGTLNDAPRAERANYYDVGVQQRFGPVTVGLDTYYKQARNLLDEGQFGAPIILTPFNYRDGYAKGVELSINYARGPFTAYGNLAVAQAKGRDIISSQFNIDPADLAFIQNHYIHLDHDQTYTASAGGTWRLGQTTLSGELIYGSGLRATPDGAAPNSGHLPGYLQVNLGASHEFARPGITVRADILTLFDKVYEIRDGSGVGVGAPQFGPRRGLYVGVSKSF